MILLFIGPSGSGKDTQAQMLADKYGFKVTSTGNVFREVAISKKKEALEVKSYIDKGEWVPDKLVYSLLEEYLEKQGADKLILTGAVRTIAQVSLLDGMLERLGKSLDKVVYFALSSDEAVKRLSGRRVCPVDKSNYHIVFKPSKVEGKCDLCGADLVQREDDRPEAIRRRLEQFEKENDPILDEYSERGILEEIDAAPPIEDIFAVLERRLGLLRETSVANMTQY